jgi:protein transport protein SEC61 subunit gamma and related proteins
MEGTDPRRDDEETLEDVVEAETAPKPAHHVSDAHVPPPGADKSFVDKAWDAQHNIERKWDAIGSGRFARVLRMARKPEPEEFRQSATIVLIGIGVIGGLGFMVFLFMDWLLETIGA